jgi:hypothetical protein
VPAYLGTKADADLNTRYRLLPGALIDKQLQSALDDLRRDPVPGVPPPRDLHSFEDDGLVLVTERTWLELLSELHVRSRLRYQTWWIQ